MIYSVNYDNPNDADPWNIPDESGFTEICSDMYSIVTTRSDGTSFTHTFWHDDPDYYGYEK
jgi:hypothetical protein